MGETIAAFLVGVAVGSVVNQLGSDLPQRRSPTLPRCRYCGRGRPWWQWIGALAYLVGRPQCPSCGASLRFRRPLVEIGMGVMYGYLLTAVGLSSALLFYGLYSAVLALVLITDLEHRVILDVVTYPALGLGLVGSLFVPQVTWQRALIGGAFGLGFFFLAAVIGRALFGAGAMGGGDVKLAAFVGVITGYPLVIEAVLLTILIGAAVSLVLLLTGARRLHDHIAYGPFLVAGALVTLLWGHPIATWFF